MGAQILVRCFELAGASHVAADRLMQVMNSPKTPVSPLRILQTQLGLHSPVTQRTEANGASAKDIILFPELFTVRPNKF